MKNKVLVAGCGISGIGAARMLLAAGKSVILYDGNDKKNKEEIRAQVADNSSDETLSIVLGTLSQDVIDQSEYCVISPGIPTDLAFVEELKKNGVPIWSEIELAYHYAKGQVIGITGTNGKTTTTALTGEIMAAHFGKDKTFVVGNIGTAYTGKALETKEDSVTVAEISSFQLETIVDFAPDVSAILNITPDHLNRHHTMENYIKAKEDITKNQKANDVCVLNYEDEVLRKFGESLSMKVLWFDSKKPVQNGCYLNGEKIIYVSEGKEEEVIDVNELNILGTHNYENVMAAVAMTISIGVPMDVIVKTLREFQAVEHRIEYVTEKRGVKFYNDSKGTNPDAAIKGIQAMNRPTLLIGGGYDKQSEYDEWIESFDGKVKKLVLIGVTKEKIADCAKRHGFTDYVFADSLEEAVNICYDNAVSGDAVLLSPACASWDMFKSYEERGRIFKDLVRNLKE